MIVCFFGFYDKEYSRNRVLRAALVQAGVTVLDCVSHKKGIQKYLDLIRQHRALKHAYDVMFVLFPGQQAMLLARLLTRKKIVFDPFISLFDSLVRDRKQYAVWHPRSLYYWCVDWMAVHSADMCLFDTYAHRDFFVRMFSFSHERSARILVGSDLSLFSPHDKEYKEEKDFKVHFHGTNIPLQGIPYILGAASILEHEHFSFTLIGSNIRKQYEGSSVSRTITFCDDVPYSDLPNHIRDADVCLGIFGDTPKVSLVIPNKVYEAWACARPVISADTPAIREIGVDRENILLCTRANAESLADALRLLKENTSMRNAIATKGRETVVRECSPEVLGRELMKVLHHVVH